MWVTFSEGVSFFLQRVTFFFATGIIFFATGAIFFCTPVYCNAIPLKFKQKSSSEATLLVRRWTLLHISHLFQFLKHFREVWNKFPSFTSKVASEDEFCLNLRVFILHLGKIEDGYILLDQKW